MNQFFSPQRFSLLVAKHWADNRRRYVLSVVAVIGLLFIWFVFNMLADTTTRMGKTIQAITFFLLLLGAGIFYANQYFRDLGAKPKGINFLLVPASTFEKLLCSILFTCIFFFIAFVAAFYLVDVIMITISEKLYNTPLPENEKGILNIFEAGRLPAEDNSPINLIWFYFSIQGAFLLGSVYFEKNSFIKTIIAGFLVFFILFLIAYLCYNMMPEGDYASLGSYQIFNDDKKDFLVTVPVWITKFLFYSLMYGTPPFLWLATYYRLKEKQV
jgi:hypothetical protein